MTLAEALKSSKPFTSMRWRKIAGAGGHVLRYEPSSGKLWFLDYNDPDGQRYSLTRYKLSERSFLVSEVLRDDYEIVDDTALMEHAWRHRSAR